MKMDPDLLPRDKLISICLSVIGTVDDLDVQQMALTALLSVGACANGEEGATFATTPEVMALLVALESPCSAVRRSALKVWRWTVFCAVNCAIGMALGGACAVNCLRCMTLGSVCAARIGG